MANVKNLLKRFRQSVVILFGIGFIAGTAQAADVFELRGIDVDITAESAAKARSLALAEGERLAFETLLKRLVLRGDIGTLLELPKQQISALIKDFSVAEEKNSAVRYVAKLNYRFKPDAVRDLLKQHGIAFAETRSKSVLILPVLEEGGRLTLWDDPNPWRDAWTQMPERSGLVPMTLALGDLADVSVINAEQALEGESERLRRMADRYKASNVLVAQAIIEPDRLTGALEVELFLTLFSPFSKNQTFVLSLASPDGQSREGLMKAAAEMAAAHLEEQWKRENLLNFGSSNILPVTIAVTSLQEWLQIRKRLEQIAVITKIDIASLSRDQVRLNLTYIGDAEQLRVALSQLDLVLTGDGQTWTLVMLTRQ